MKRSKFSGNRGATAGENRLNVSTTVRGKPTDNAFIESFNGKFRAECLNAHWFMSLDDAVRKCEAWRREYNEVRPHSVIGNKPPISLLSASAAHGPPDVGTLDQPSQVVQERGAAQSRPRP